MCPVVVCRVAGDIIFAVDASGSVGKNNFQKLMDAVLRTVLMLDLTTSVGNAGARVIFFTFILSIRIILESLYSSMKLINETVKNDLLHFVSPGDHCVIDIVDLSEVKLWS